VMQLEVRHSFQLESGESAAGATYFTIHELHRLDLAHAGFPGADLTKTAIVSQKKIVGTASVEMGRTLSVSMGCVACHSADGTTEGKTGPTWKGLFGRDREFTDGSVESANEFYLRDSMLNPQKKVVKGFAPGMASYKGVLTDPQIDSLILYIKSLQ
jgi:cytochrome c2